MRASFARILAAALFAVLAGAAAERAEAQSANCRNLQAQIAALSRGDPARANTYARAAQKQRGELERTSAYANSIGCQKRQFLIFGQAAPPQCGAIDAQMQRMRANLAQLDAQANEASSGDQGAIRALNYRYNNECRPQPQVASNPPPPRGLLDQLFGVRGEPGPGPYPPVSLDPPPRQANLRQLPLEPVMSPLDDSGDETAGRHSGGGKAVCVRKCDGGFFPVSYSARSRNLDELSDLCRALCPNAEVGLYTFRTSGEIEEAVSQDGENYTDLPNAFKYQKSFDPTCSCKRAGQNWVQALAEAERVLGRESSKDIVVTAQKSDELARPKPDPRARPSASARPLPNASQPAVDDAAARDAAIAGRAGNETTSLATGDGAKARLIAVDQGAVQDVVGPNGDKRRVRVIGLTP